MCICFTKQRRDIELPPYAVYFLLTTYRLSIRNALIVLDYLAFVGETKNNTLANIVLVSVCVCVFVCNKSPSFSPFWQWHFALCMTLYHLPSPFPLFASSLFCKYKSLYCASCLLISFVSASFLFSRLTREAPRSKHTNMSITTWWTIWDWGCEHRFSFFPVTCRRYFDSSLG